MVELLTFGTKLYQARKAAKLTQARVGDALGVSPQAVSGWERDEAMPEIEKLEKLTRLLGIDLWFLLRSVDGDGHLDYMKQIESRAAEEKRTPKLATENLIAGDMLVGARDFPIYAAAAGGEGFMIVHTDVMEYVKRPVILEGVPDSYGVLVIGESMVPAYRPNDMALVHPRRPMERESDVILYDHDHRTGDAKSMIKRLIGFNDRSLKLEQYNPAKTFSEHRADWPICHQVVGLYKGRR